MCEAAETELRKRYGVAGKLSQKQVNFEKYFKNILK